MPSENAYILDVPKSRSSLIERLEYDESTLIVYLRYSNVGHVYKNVGWETFEEMCNSVSMGKYYNEFFKHLKYTIMSEKKRPQTKNQASDQKRFIKMSINVQKINREWIVRGEKGDYLNLTLQMLPDGQLDKFGNLGMITQDVPKDIYDAAEAERKGSGKDIKGEILGNGAEFDWGSKEGAPSAQFNIGNMTAPLDDLPF